jgi:hypothetical protein
MHPEVSTNEDRKSSKEDLQMHRLVSLEGSERRRTTSNKKYNFLICIMT